MISRIFLLITIFITLAALFPAHTYAQNEKLGGIKLEPAIIDIEILAEQDEKVIEFNVTNYTGQTVELDLFALNFQQRQDSGIVQFLADIKENYSYSLASFVSLPFPSISLEAGTSRTVPVTIRNRQDLSPGGHYAAFVVRLREDGSNTDKTQILPSVSSLILLRKTGGELYNLSLHDISFPSGIFSFKHPKTIDLMFRNEGNIHLVPRGTIEIRDMFGRLISKGNINISSGYVFPTSQRLYTIDMMKVTKSYPISFNMLHVSGNDSLQKTVFLTKQSYIYINPLVLAGLVIVSLILIHHIWLRRKVKRS